MYETWYQPDELEEIVTATADNKPKLEAGERFVDESFALAALPKRSFGTHKWEVGGLVLVAGGPGYVGAAALAALAAGRAGAGTVGVAVPRAAIGAIAAIVPEATFIPLPEGDLGTSIDRALEAIATKLERSHAAVVGPGLGTDEYVDTLLGSLFGRKAQKRHAGFGFGQHAASSTSASNNGMASLLGSDKPAVIDADGLTWLSKQDEWWTDLRPQSLILTPHVGEMSRLIGKSTDEIVANPRRIAEEAAIAWDQVIVLKCGFTVATDGKNTLVADDAPTSLATAGAGDVFAGVIGAFLAQGVAPLSAAGLGIYLGCRAARRIESDYGVLGLVASDLPPAIAREIASLERKRDATHG